MKKILIILRKEFQQIFRNKQMLGMIFIMPLLQLFVLVNATTFEIKDVNTYIIDNDYSSFSNQLKNKFAGSPFFKIVGYSNSDKLAEDYMALNKSKITIKIPKDFEKNLMLNKNTKIQFIINAEDGAAAGVIISYATQILANWGQNITPMMTYLSTHKNISAINVNEQFWYNPELNYKEYMVPGILGILISIIGLFLSSINIVREKEIGTIEQLNVTPIRKYEFVIGKLLPFLIIGLFELAFGLSLAKLIYNITILGSIPLLFGLTAVYLMVVLSLGLIISTVSETQQQSLFVTFFFNILLILLSGLFTSIDSMPQWAKILAFFDPFSHFVEIMRRVIMKGAGLWEVKKQALVLVVYATVLFTIAVLRYRKVEA
jgi:ABC-2 type transport system permease protein